MEVQEVREEWVEMIRVIDGSIIKESVIKDSVILSHQNSHW